MAKDVKTAKTAEEIEKERLEKKNNKKARHLDSRPFAEISNRKLIHKSKKKKRLNRSKGGDIALFLFLAICGLLSILPLYMIVINAFKPLDELLIFPPNLYVIHPTLDNFTDLGVVLATSLVPLSRYIFNTVLVTVLGAVLHIVIGSTAAYVLSKYNIPGKTAIFAIIQFAICFPSAVQATPNYIILNSLGLIDTYWSIVLPLAGSSMGVFLMKQFMDQIPNDLVESGKLDGAGEFTIYWKIIMPLVKPAWVTIIILDFQSLWQTYGSTTIYREDYKMLAYAINQIASAGVSRQGTMQAVTLIMISVPIVFFIIQQSNVLETMAHSGMK